MIRGPLRCAFFAGFSFASAALSRLARRAGAAVLAGVASSLATGAGNDFEEPPPWVEVETALPAVSTPLRPIRIDLGPAAENTFAVDAPSIAVGTDGVIRFTMVVTSPRGAVTVTHEGIRCDSRERRVYAYGRPDGSWSRARNARWARIEPQAINAYANLLNREFFCPGGIVVRNAAEAVMALERGGHPDTPRLAN